MHPVTDPLQVEYCGEWYRVEPGAEFTIGRTGDLDVDDNPFLHRSLLTLSNRDGIWILENVGSRLAVTVSDSEGRLQSWLAPGGSLPLVFGKVSVVFSAGATTYELFIYIPDPVFAQTRPSSDSGTTTVGDVALTESQKLLILALAEHALQREGTGMSEVPSSAKAAQRLGWAMTKFNRKLDNVCDKLSRSGVPGLRGGAQEHARNRRVRLVEYAVAARLVTPSDLPLLDAAQENE